MWGASAGERLRQRERLQRRGSGMAWAGAPPRDGDRTGQGGGTTEDGFPAALASRPRAGGSDSCGEAAHACARAHTHTRARARSWEDAAPGRSDGTC